MSYAYPSLKRMMDVVGALIGLLLFTVPMLVIGFLIYWRMGRPVLFKQIRAGKDGKPFTIYKFRTMTNSRDDDGELLPADDRITPLGRKLRNSSADELPELLNVLIGEMSLVGPRPLHMEYNDRYDEIQRKRLNVKPGMTGLAVIQGREHLSWDEKFRYDVHYVENRSITMDIQIILKTVWMVLNRTGSEPPDGPVSEPFEGY